MEDVVTLPVPPPGFEYKLVPMNKKVRVMNKHPSELTPRQLATLKYREKNKDKIKEKNRLKYESKKSKNFVVVSGQSD